MMVEDNLKPSEKLMKKATTMAKINENHKGKKCFILILRFTRLVGL
jgi:hypothetical protein